MTGTHLPRMLLGAELRKQLSVLPDYTDAIRVMDPAERLMRLQDIYQLYIPSQMSEEIYCKLYMALRHSLEKKNSPALVRQRNENFRAIRRMNYQGIIGGSDSFTIIGESGIGKSTAISRTISIIEDQMQIDNVIPFVAVQCPFDSSPKNLLLEILRVVDETIGSHYYENAKRTRATTDMLIGSVSQIALGRIGVLIVDEIQNVVNSRNGRILVGMLTQLINNSGISICMVGTPPCTVFFEQEMQLARRSVGLSYGAMDCGDGFCDLCNTLWKYQYVQNMIPLSEDVIYWLYEHSRGNISILMALFHDAQETGILSGRDCLNIGTLDEAFKKRLALLHDFINPEPVKVRPARKKKALPQPKYVESCESMEISKSSLLELCEEAKDRAVDFVSLLQEMITVEEVTV